MPTTTLPQGTLSYAEHGPPDGPPVVFVHGILVDGSLWRDVAPALGAQGYRCLVPDLPLGSHRLAMAPDADLAPRGVARLILAFLERLDLDGVCLVANDTGGAITQFLLDIDDARIGAVAFTNCDTFDRFPPPPFKQLFSFAKLPGAIAAIVPTMKVTALRHRLGYGPLMAQPIDAALTRSWIDPLGDARIRRDLRKVLQGIDPADLTATAARLDRFPGPVLVAWGLADKLFRVEDGRRLAACFGRPTVVEIPDASTFVALDQPERLTRELAAFLDAVHTDRPAADRPVG